MLNRWWQQWFVNSSLVLLVVSIDIVVLRFLSIVVKCLCVVVSFLCVCFGLVMLVIDDIQLVWWFELLISGDMYRCVWNSVLFLCCMCSLKFEFGVLLCSVMLSWCCIFGYVLCGQYGNGVILLMRLVLFQFVIWQKVGFMCVMWLCMLSMCMLISIEFFIVWWKNVFVYSVCCVLKCWCVCFYRFQRFYSMKYDRLVMSYMSVLLVRLVSCGNVYMCIVSFWLGGLSGRLQWELCGRCGCVDVDDSLWLFELVIEILYFDDSFCGMLCFRMFLIENIVVIELRQLWLLCIMGVCNVMKLLLKLLQISGEQVWWCVLCVLLYVLCMVFCICVLLGFVRCWLSSGGCMVGQCCMLGVVYQFR